MPSNTFTNTHEGSVPDDDAFGHRRHATGIRGSLAGARATALLALVVVACDGAAQVQVDRPIPGPDVAVEWNRLVLEVAEAEDGFLTLKGLRTAAMVHLAMHDVLARLVGRYPSYLPTDQTNDGTIAEPNLVAATAQAAFTVAANQYPDRRELFEEALQRSVAGDDPPPEARAGTSGDSTARSRELGRQVAEAILVERLDDGWNTQAEYQFHPMAPGVYAEFDEHSGTPEGFVFGAGWALARPFALGSADQFRSPPPPEITSDAYTAAFDEVKQVGARTSDSRTEDQTHLAMWWKEFVESSHNRLARELVSEESLDLVDATRLFALLQVAVFDAYVNVFENKFHHNHWRPYTAIRWAEHDGNPATEPDPEWTNLHDHTYAFPSYPSAHGTACAAAAAVLADTFGDQRPLTMTIAEVDSGGPMSAKVPMDPPTRSFSSFSEAAMECSLSRVYLGIHFRYDSVEGNRLGHEIGEYVVGNALRAASE